MTHREKLQEQYEEAVFALLIDEVTEQEGQELLAEAERLNNDPDAAIPEELDRKCRKIIRDSGRKEKRKATGRVTWKVIQRVAVAVLAAALLLGAAYAAIPEFRAGVQRLIKVVSGNTVTFKLGAVSDIEPVPDSIVYSYNTPPIPEGYELNLEMTEEEAGDRFYQYENEAGDWIQIEISKLAASSTTVGTSGAQAVTDVIVHGYEGLCVEGDECVYMTWVDTDRLVSLSLACTALDKEAVWKMVQYMYYSEVGPVDTLLDSVLYSYGLPQLPEGYELDSVGGKTGCRTHTYTNKEQDVINVAFSLGSTDQYLFAEMSDVTDVTVNGYKGVCVEKDGTVRVSWVDTDRQVTIALSCTALDQKAVLEMTQTMIYMEPTNGLACTSPDSVIYCYTLPQIPEGYEFNADVSGEDNKFRFYRYDNEDQEYISLSINKNDIGLHPAESAMAVTSVIVNGYEGIYQELPGSAVDWVDTDRMVRISLYCSDPDLDKDTLMEMAQAIQYIQPEGGLPFTVTHTVTFGYGIPQVPEEYELDRIEEEIYQRQYDYVNKENDRIMVEIQPEGVPQNMEFFIEDDPAVTTVTVNGYEGLCGEKDGTVQVNWYDTDRAVLLTLYCTALDRETVLEMVQAMKYTPPGT